MERVYFISDLHLGAFTGEQETEKIKIFLDFLSHLKNNADVLYIVGDLYNFWFEYKHAVPKCNLRVIAGLIELVEAGVEVRYLLGNHDQWHGDYFARETGIKIFRSATEVEHNGLRLYVVHGDGVAAGDRKNQTLKRIFQSEVNRRLFRFLHPDVGIALAQLVARKSAQKGIGGYEEDYRAFAADKLSQGYDAVILGHTHIPLLEKINDGYYINLGIGSAILPISACKTGNSNCRVGRLDRGPPLFSETRIR